MAFATEKKKQGHSLIVMVQFVTLGYKIATKDFTLEVEGIDVDFDGLLSQKGLGTLSTTVVETFNSTGSVSTFSFKIADYVGSALPDLIENSGDPITGTDVKIYVKFDDGTDTDGNSLEFFNGFVRDFEIGNNEVRLTVETRPYNDLPILPKISLQSLLPDIAETDEVDADLRVPLQYGNFNFDGDARFYGNQTNNYAICPFIRTTGGEHLFAVAAHTMNDVPDYTEASSASDPFIYFKRNNRLIGMTRIASGTPTAPTFEASGITYLRMWNQQANAYLFTTFEEEHNPNETNPAGIGNMLKGKPTEGATIGSNQTATFRGWDSGMVVLDPTLNQIDVFLYVSKQNGSGGATVTTTRLRQLSDDAVVDSATNGTFSNDSWNLMLSITNDTWVENIEDYYLEITVEASYSLDVKTITLRHRLPGWTLADAEESALYLRCKGRQYSGTWGSRKTSGALITHPVDALESIIRDEYGASIDTNSFDEVNAHYSGCTVGFTLFRATSGLDLLNQFCEAFNFVVFSRPYSVYSLLFCDRSNNFTFSDNATAQNADKFLQDVSVVDGAFVELPIKKGSVTVGTTDRKSAITKLGYRYKNTFSGEFLRTYEVDNGGTIANTREIQNPFVGDPTDISVIGDYIFEMLSTVRYRISFESFLDAIDIDAGHVVNFQHDYITAAQLGEASAAAAKFVVNVYQINLRSGTVKLTLIHVPTNITLGSF